MSKVIEVVDSTFNSEVLEASSPVVVDFWAPWCGPCRKLGPVIDEISSEYENRIKFVKINTDENLKIAKEFSISGLPSILIFKDGEAKERLVVLLPKSTIISNIEKYI